MTIEKNKIERVVNKLDMPIDNLYAIVRLANTAFRGDTGELSSSIFGKEYTEEGGRKAFEWVSTNYDALTDILNAIDKLASVAVDALEMGVELELKEALK